MTEGTKDTLDFVLGEAKTNKHYDALSAVKLGHWPIVLTACRAVPPHAWRALLPNVS